MYHKITKEKIHVNRYTPLIITCLVVLIDQSAKFFIVKTFTFQDIYKVIGDLLWIVHVRNTGVAFSIGINLENIWRIIIVIIVPSLLILYLLWFTLFSTQPQTYKFLTATMLGGGIGNMIDRIFRTEGVVDFISVKFYGVFGFERWPTFNFSDMSIVISLIIWIIITFFFQKSKIK